MSGSIRFRDEQADGELRCSAVDGFGIPDVGIAPAGHGSGDHLAGIDELTHVF